MAQITGFITVTLRPHKRWFFWPALYLVAGAGGIVSMFSYRVADGLLRHAATLLARYGIRVVAE